MKRIRRNLENYAAHGHRAHGVLVSRGAALYGGVVLSDCQSASGHRRQAESRALRAGARTIDRVRLRDNWRRIGRRRVGQPIVRGRGSHGAAAGGRRRRDRSVRRADVLSAPAALVVRLAVQDGAVIQLLPGDAESSM